MNLRRLETRTIFVGVLIALLVFALTLLVAG